MKKTAFIPILILSLLLSACGGGKPAVTLSETTAATTAQQTTAATTVPQTTAATTTAPQTTAATTTAPQTTAATTTAPQTTAATTTAPQTTAATTTAPQTTAATTTAPETTATTTTVLETTVTTTEQYFPDLPEYGRYVYQGVIYYISRYDVAVTGYIESELPSELVIPAHFNGKPVLVIEENAFLGCTVLVSLVIPEGVFVIGDCAFNDCTSLKSLTLPSTLEDIGRWPFSGCDRLVITAPEGSLAESHAIEGGIPLASDDNSGSEPDEPDGPISDLYVLDGVTYDISGDFAVIVWFDVSLGISELVIPSSVYGLDVLVINDSAFSNATTLTSIVLPDTLTSIGHMAFMGCTGLISISIPDSVTSLGQSVFETCLSLVSVYIGDGVTAIPEAAFRWCNALSEVKMTDSVTSLKEAAFEGCSALEMIFIPESVTELGHRVFDGCPLLTIDTPVGSAAEEYAKEANIELLNKEEDKVDTVPAEGEYTSDGIVYRIENGTATIIGYDPSYNFGSGQYGLYTLPSTVGDYPVTTIGASAFYDCRTLIRLVIPEGVTSIGPSAFQHCASLRYVTIPNSMTFIGSMAFWSTGVGLLIIGSPGSFAQQYARSNSYSFSATYNPPA